MMRYRSIKQSAMFTLVVLMISMVLALMPHTVRARQILDVRVGGESKNCPPECWHVTINSALNRVVDNPHDPDVIRVWRNIRPDAEEPLLYLENLVINKSVIIEAGEPGITLHGSNSGRTILIDGRNRQPDHPLNVTIRGLTITGGNATFDQGIHPGDRPYRAGGGLAILDANAIIEHSIIRENVASELPDGSGFGGGVYMSGGAPILRNNVIEQNHAALEAGDYVGFGGGIAIYQSAARLEGNLIRQNVAVQGSASAGFAAGGGIYIQGERGGPAPTLIGNVIENNMAGGASASGFGGGVYLQGLAASILNNTIATNRAGSQGDSFGGGIYVWNATPLIHGNTIAGNLAGTETARRGHGGGIAVSASGGVIEHNMINGNRSGGAEQGIGGGLYINSNPSGGEAPRLNANQVVQNTAQAEGGVGQGGGLYVFAATPTLTNNVFAQNRDSEGGGGMLVDGGSVTLLHNTIADNASTGTDVAAGVWLRSGAVMAATNTIIANHDYGIHLNDTTTRATLTHTLFHGTNVAHRITGSGMITNTLPATGDPRFVSTSAAAPNYHIRVDSAAREAAQASALGADIDGRLRPVGAPDIGADEYAVHNFLPVVKR